MFAKVSGSMPQLRKAASTLRVARSLSTCPVPITVASGDGIGPEIMASTMDVLSAAGANIAPEYIDIGEKVYLAGHTSGIEDSSWDSLRRTKVFLKSPITTPIGSGYKSLNVTIRKTLGLFANVRPCVSYDPFVPCAHPKMDVVIVRENEEDLYAGIEHRQTNQVYQCLKLISRPGCEKIVRYAFDYARTHKRKKVTVVVKDNIMKLTDGLFAKVFEEIGSREYPDIARDRIIVDIGAALLADKPDKFDVMVMPNLYGDILSDIAAQITGSVGLGASANIGEHVAMFEAIHGSAPDIAGKDVANPSGLLLAAVQMLLHVGQGSAATRVHNAWLAAIEDGLRTPDIFKGADGTKRVGCKEFTSGVISRLGAAPKKLKAAAYDDASADHEGTRTAHHAVEVTERWSAPPQTKILTGVDVFLEWTGGRPDDLAAKLQAAAAKAGVNAGGLELKLITNRGVKVWPKGFPETFCTDHWRCRFRPSSSSALSVNYGAVLAVMNELHKDGLDVIKTENLCYFQNQDGSLQPGFSLGQGE